MSTEFFFKSIQFENYRGLSNLDIPTLKRINIIGGRNGSGKTTLLEGIGLILGRRNPGILNMPFAARHMKLSFPNGFDYIFSKCDSSKRIKISGETCSGRLIANISSKEVQDVQVSSVLNPGISVDMSSGSNISQYGIELDISIGGKIIDKAFFRQTSSNQAEFRYQRLSPLSTPPVVIITSLLMCDPMEDAKSYSVLLKEKKIPQLLKTLQFINPAVKSLQLLQEQEAPVLYAIFEDDSMMQTSLLGGGFRMLLSIALLLMTIKDGVFLFDEIDNSIHHSQLPKFWALIARLANEQNGQIFAVTHSRECIGAALEGIATTEHIADLNYIRLDRYGEEIHSEIYTGDELNDALTSGWEVR
jgi:AAA15 family ATPase/GTPase